MAAALAGVLPLPIVLAGLLPWLLLVLAGTAAAAVAAAAAPACFDVMEIDTCSVLCHASSRAQ